MVIVLISNAQFKRAGLQVKQNLLVGFCLSFRAQSVFNHGRFEPTISPRVAAESLNRSPRRSKAKAGKS